jgi:hypothetical protein
MLARFPSATSPRRGSSNRPKVRPLDDCRRGCGDRIDQLRCVGDVSASGCNLRDHRCGVEFAEQVHVVAIGSDHRPNTVLREPAERRGNACARKHARAVQHRGALRRHQLQIAIGACDTVRGHEIRRQKAKPVQIFGWRATAVPAADRRNLGLALRKMGGDGNIEFTRAGGARPQQIRTAGVGRVRAHRKANPAVAASIPALIERIPGVHIGLAIIARVMHHAVRTRLGIRGRKQIRRAIKADSHFLGGVEHLRDGVAERLHDRGGAALQQLQNAEPRDGEPLLRRQQLGAALGQRQQNRIDDALVVPATIAVLGMRPGDGFAEAVVVQVQKAGQHETARSVEDLGGGGPVARDGGDPFAFQQYPVIAQHLLRTILARQHIAAKDRDRAHAGFTFQNTAVPSRMPVMFERYAVGCLY